MMPHCVYEEHFYLVLPLLVLWLSRRACVGKTVAVMLLFVALGIVMRSYALVHVLRRMSPEDDPLYGVRYIESVYYPPWARLDGLIAGVGLALMRIFRPVWWAAMTRWASAVLIGGVALLGCSVWMFYDRFDSNTGVAATSTVIGFPCDVVGDGDDGGCGGGCAVLVRAMACAGSKGGSDAGVQLVPDAQGRSVSGE